MDRRAYVRGLAALLGGALAGCSSGGEVPETAQSPPAPVREATRANPGGVEDGNGPPEDVTTGFPEGNPEGANSVILLSQDVFADDDGGLVVTIGVRNEGVARATALVRVTVDTESGQLELERYVDLPPGAETRVRFTPDVPRDVFNGMDPRILPETPATPLPTDRSTPTPTSTESATATDADDGNGTANGTVGSTTREG